MVGAYAMSLHGYVRYTGDIDIWIDATLENAAKMLTAIQEFGFGSLSISEADLLKKDSVIQLGYEPVRIDILNSVSGLSFENSWQNKTDEILDGVSVHAISLKDLRLNKLSTGRKKDLGDLDNLPEG